MNQFGGDSEDKEYEVKKIWNMTLCPEENCLMFLVEWEGYPKKTWTSLSCFNGGLKHPRIRNYKKFRPDKYKEVMDGLRQERRTASRLAQNSTNQTAKCCNQKVASRSNANANSNNQQTEYEIREITDIRYSDRKTIEFSVTWEECGTKSWEPLECFRKLYDHPSIMEYKENNAEKFNSVMEQKSEILQEKKEEQQENGQTRSTMVEVGDDDEEFQKPDPTMGKESQALYNTRLRNDHDKLLLDLAGSQRISRSNAREIRGEPGNSTSSSDRPSTDSPEENTVKMNAEKKKRGKKTYSSSASNDASTRADITDHTVNSRAKSSRSEFKIGDEKAQKKRSAPIPEETDSSDEKDSKVAKTSNNQRDQQMNAPSPGTSSPSLDQENCELTGVSMESENERSEVTKKQKAMTFADKLEKLRSLLPQDEEQKGEEKEVEQEVLDMDTFLNKLRSHQILQRIMKTLTTVGLSEEDLIQRDNAVAEVLQDVLTDVPQDFFAEQDSDGNTLFHIAVQFFAGKGEVFCKIAQGSPSNIQNKRNMTAVDQCILIESLKHASRVLRFLYLQGGSIQQFLDDQLIERNSDQNLVTCELRRRAEEIQSKLDVAYKEAWTRLGYCKLYTGTGFFAQYGPVISFPRINKANPGDRQKIEFLIPQCWVRPNKGDRFILVVMPVFFELRKNEYQVVADEMNLASPIVCGRKCNVIEDEVGMAVMDATYAVQSHFYRHFSFLNGTFETTNKVDSRVITVSLGYNCNSSLIDFLSCRLILFKHISNSASE